MTERMREPRYEPFGWHHWSEHFFWSYQFRRALGETQEGGGAVSEVFQAASRMKPGDDDSWHEEWLRAAERNDRRGDEEEEKGHIRTAMNCWLRAADYYRSAEFWLLPDDARRLATFDKCERASRKWFAYLDPPGEAVAIPYENGVSLPAYFIKPKGQAKTPVLISFGGLDSFKDELWFMTGHGAVQRGIAVLMVDGPGQGGTLRRHKIPTRHDYEVPVGRCIDFLLKRSDVDASRIAVSGSSLGGYYSARAGSKEHRLAACISHGAIWDVEQRFRDRGEGHALANHMKWVFGAKSMAEAIEKARPFKLEGVLGEMRCPYLVLHGGHDVLGVENSKTVYEYARSKGVKVTLRLTSAEETGAEHCQHDNPTLGQELMIDWLADVFRIDQRQLSIAP
ncbi:MAG TPA: alpha/beta hydrolase [Burkholderiales bacterium]|jgi:dienelactone hydrolase|nr:alpha/beta hydrolase [Burkholderiales bacterium]